MLRVKSREISRRGGGSACNCRIGQVAEAWRSAAEFIACAIAKRPRDAYTNPNRGLSVFSTAGGLHQP
jgi:hypothetical protein